MSHQHLIPHGGIGQFALGIVKMLRERDVKVDVITDKKPANSSFIQRLEDEGATFICPSESYPYTQHSAIFMYGDSYCYERMANFRNAIIKAFQTNLYDAIVCNTYESIQVASVLGLEEHVQIIAYTHLESQIFADTTNPFLNSVNEMMRNQLTVPRITIGTQSEFNAAQFEKAQVLPIPLYESDLLEEYHGERKGVLFIGRWEEGKNPEAYLDLIQHTKLPAKVMTSATSAKKFRERLDQIGVEYEILVSVVGSEKNDFIKSSRVAYNPSTVESYGIAFLEQQIQLPTVALRGMRWLNNFDDRFYFSIDKQSAHKLILDLYDRYKSPKDWYSEGALAYHKERYLNIPNMWMTVLDGFTVKQSKSNTAGILEHNTIRYGEYIESLERKQICIDDIRSVLSNKHKFKVIYTDRDTYLTRDPGFIPESDQPVGTSLFEGFD